MVKIVRGNTSGYPYIPPDELRELKNIDVLDYLKAVDPTNLKRIGYGAWRLRNHDSFKISNGKWCWFSRGIGGRSAFDYLVKVEELPWQAAALRLREFVSAGLGCASHSVTRNQEKNEKVLNLPRFNKSNERATAYLMQRGIDAAVIDYFVKCGKIKESVDGNVCFLGYDKEGCIRYATGRKMGGTIKLDYGGSDKRFSFRHVNEGDELHIFESAIDALSYATLLKIAEESWQINMLSLSGVYAGEGDVMPLALTGLKEDYPDVERVVLHLDNDEAGRKAAAWLQRLLVKEGYAVAVDEPKLKDVNDDLLEMLRHTV